MSLVTLLIVILLIGLIISVFNRGSFGYGPSSIFGIVLLILVVLIVTGYV